jgi:hypothetical protein
LLQDATEPWWIIGSVAVALHGGSPGAIRDIDVVLGERDALLCLPRLGLDNGAATRSSLFRSSVFGRWTEPPVHVELMAGLRVNGPGGWRPLVIHSREEVQPGLFVPSRKELGDILRQFGRKKDLRRAATLD